MSKDVLALDFDGTLVRSFTAEPLPEALAAVRQIDSDVRVVIITNQGGPAYRIVGSARHPSPGEVAQNLDQGLRAVGLPPARVDLLYVATFPPAGFPGGGPAAQHAASLVAHDLNAELHRRGWAESAYATSSPAWRKPSPGMLQGAAAQLVVRRAAILYVGDQESDSQAAAAAGCRFQWAADWWAGRMQ